MVTSFLSHQSSTRLFSIGTVVPPFLVIYFKMSGSSRTSVSFDRALQREKTRQKRHRQGGLVPDLGQRLEEHRFDEQFDTVQVIEEPVVKKIKQETPDYDRIVEELIQQCRPSHELDHCPFHDVLVEFKESQQGWKYCRCPVKACPLFCGQDQMSDWLPRLHHVLHASYKEQPGDDLSISLPFTCRCEHEQYRGLRLHQSHSSKNPNRFFLSCQHRACPFFQWLDLPLRTVNAKVWQTVA